MRLTLCLVALLLATLALAAPVWQAPFSLDKTAAYPCQWAAQAPVLDGKLDDPAWAQAVVIEGVIVPPKLTWPDLVMTKPRPATSQSHARLLWDAKYLYFAAEWEDRDIYCVSKPLHDIPFGVDDIAELFVKPKDELPYYWELHVVPSGGTRDYFYARRGAGGEARWLKYDSGLEAKVTVQGTFDDWSDRDNKWLVEMRVPWAAFAQMGGQPQPGDLWRFLVSRYDYSVHLEDGVELSAAAPLTWANFHEYESYPYLRFVK